MPHNTDSMLGRYRLLVAALGVCLGNCAVAQEPPAPKPSEIAQEAAHDADPPAPVPQQVVVPSPLKVELEQSQDDERRAAKGEAHGDEDIQIQRDTLTLTERGYWLNIINAVLLVVTLLLTAIATAIGAIAVRREDRQSRRETRAYVGVTKCEQVEFEPEKGAVFRITFINAGASPARNVSMASELFVATADYESSIPGRREELLALLDEVDFSLHPGVENFSPIKCPVGLGLSFVLKGNCFLFIYGIITYEDIFGEKRETRYAFKCAPGGKPNPDNRISYCRVGNGAT